MKVFVLLIAAVLSGKMLLLNTEIQRVRIK